MTDCSAGNHNLYHLVAGDGSRRFLTRDDFTGSSRLLKESITANTRHFHGIDQMMESIRVFDEKLLKFDMSRKMARLQCVFDQQWMNPLGNLSRKFNLIVSSFMPKPAEINAITSAIANSALVLGAMPKTYYPIPHVDVAHNMPALITRGRRPLLSAELFEEDDPPSYFGDNLDANLLRELDRPNFRMSASEFRESFRDLHRKPYPDLTGAISHAMAGWLSVARVIDGDDNANPKEILARNPDMMPGAMRQAIQNMWGYSSQYARKVSESREPTYDEAELVVSVSAAAATYLVRKSIPIDGASAP